MSGTDYASRVPHYTFSTLAEQETELAANPLLRRMIASRRKSGDPHRRSTTTSTRRTH